MERNKKTKIVLFVLFVIAIFVWANAFKPSALEGTDKENEESFKSVLNGENLLILISKRSKKIERKNSLFPNWGRNPFYQRASSQGTRPAETPLLEGIFWDEEDPRAIIKDTVVRVGDKIDMYTVTDISKDKVVIRDGRKYYELKIEFY